MGWSCRFVVMASVTFGLLNLVAPYAAPSASEDRLDRAQSLLEAGRLVQAERLAREEVDTRPSEGAPHLLLARILAAERKHSLAIASCERAIELDPRLQDAHYIRGRCRLAKGDANGALEDFARLIELRPEVRNGLWENGIAMYYAGRFQEGAEQFALYQEVYPNDVENAVWRYLCMKETDGAEVAKREMLPVVSDGRIPMMEIYALFKGTGSVAGVVDAAARGDATTDGYRDQQFYAHLYLGLYFHAHGDRSNARRHIKISRDQYRIGHYMWDIANMHAVILEKRPSGPEDELPGTDR